MFLSFKYTMLIIFLLFLIFHGIDGFLGKNSNATKLNMTLQSIVGNELNHMKSAIQSVNDSRLKEVLQDVVRSMENEMAKFSNITTVKIERGINYTAKGLGHIFWEIYLKIFNNSKLREDEKPLALKILQKAGLDADAKLPEPLSKPVNITEVLLEERIMEEKFGERDIVI